MAHKNQQIFCKKIKEKFPKYFENITVLDVGSLDVNGNNRYLFENCYYYGIDVVDGPNVNIVTVAHYFNPPIQYNTIISTNALEHDMYWKLTIKRMYDLLLSDGLLLISCASKWKEHGTLNTNPHASGTAQREDVWANYYKNLTIEDITENFKLDLMFSKYNIEVNKKDLQFWGIKK